MRPVVAVFILISSLAANLTARDFGLDSLKISVAHDGLGAVPEPSRAKAPRAKSAPAAAVGAVQKEWTVMVFLNAKNNLETFGMEDINEMEMVGSTSKVNVVVEMGRMAGYDSSDGDWKGVRRYYVTRDINPSRISSQLVQDIGAVNMGDARELLDFMRWTKERYPAKRYALILWNHGSGWLKDEPVQDRGKGISYDEETGNSIDTPQLGRVLAQAGGVDLLASDACMMQMAEIAYEVKDSVAFMAGSEETEPGAGYSYYRILLPLAINPSMPTEKLGRIVVAAYWKSNMIGFQAATHSLLDVSKAAGLGERMDRFARAAIASGDKKGVRNARLAAQKYDIMDNKDLRHFARLVEEGTSNEALKTAARELYSYIDGSLVLVNMTSILPRSNSNGVAVYIPSLEFDKNYSEIKLARDTRWDEFLKWQVE